MRVNKKQLAEILGDSERTLTEWQKDPSFPIEENNGRGKQNVYCTVDVIAWKLARVQGKKKETAKERLERIRGDREELAHQRDLEDVVPAAEVEEALVNVVIAIRADLLNNNAQLKATLDTAYDIDLDIGILHDHSRHLLEHLSNLDPQSTCGAQAGVEEVCTTPEDDHSGVGAGLSLSGA